MENFVDFTSGMAIDTLWMVLGLLYSNIKGNEKLSDFFSDILNFSGYANEDYELNYRMQTFFYILNWVMKEVDLVEDLGIDPVAGERIIRVFEAARRDGALVYAAIDQFDEEHDLIFQIDCVVTNTEEA